MALSEAQKQSVLFYLGWPGQTITANSTGYTSVVADRLKNLTADIEQRAIKLLEKLASYDERLDGAACRLSAKRVDDIELNPEEISMLNKERRRVAKELASLLDIAYRGKSGSMVGICN